MLNQKFGKKDLYEILICELNQVKQEWGKKMKDYIVRLQDLLHRIMRNLHAQWHMVDNSIFKEI